MRALAESVGEFFLDILRRLGIAPNETEEAQELWISAEQVNCRCSIEPLRAVDETSFSSTVSSIVNSSLATGTSIHWQDVPVWGPSPLATFCETPKKSKRRTCAYCGTSTRKRKHCPACGAPLV